MLSKSQVGLVRSLHQKKFRKEQKLFIAEGIKTINEFLTSGYTIDTLFYTQHLPSNLLKIQQKIKLQQITPAELLKISLLSAPQDALALIHIPEITPFGPESFKGAFTLMLDGIQDPGNMGTIIRTADWFGFDRLICSEECVEVYNPKVVQATMGSLARVTVHYADLPQLLKSTTVPVYGAVLNGESLYTSQLGSEGIMVLGNEGKGISAEVATAIDRPITIPRFGDAESLNVAVSAAIICSEIKRRV